MCQTGEIRVQIIKFLLLLLHFCRSKKGIRRLGEERLEKDLDRVEFDGGGSGCGGE